MSLLVAISKKEQVAKELKSQMLSGKISLGAKLLSVRDLAAKFSVSTRIIVDALDILEDEMLITREPGRGVFASKDNLKNTIDVYLLGYFIKTNRDVYFSHLSRIAHPPFLRDGFSFMIRTVPPTAQVLHRHFLHELKRIEQLPIDCLLINAAALNKKQIMACMAMEIPVIFIGDFSSGLYPEVHYNHITGDNAWIGQESVRQVVECENCHELTIYSGSLEHYFFRKFYDGALNEAGRLGVKLHLVEMPRGITTSIPIAKRREIYLQKVNEAKANDWCSCPAIVSGDLLNELMLEAFSANSVESPFFRGRECEKSFEQFFKTIYGRIDAVVKNPHDYRKIRLKPKINMERIIMEEIYREANN